MYRLSYRDLEWSKVFLQPERYTIKDGKRVRLGSPADPEPLICFKSDDSLVSICMPAGQGKISDAGYDQMVCLAAAIPVYDNVRFRGKIRVVDFPSLENRNGQEGIGIFFRDTMSQDPVNGYPYSNMAAAGIVRGRPGFFVRDGITGNDIEHIRNHYDLEENGWSGSLAGEELEIVMEKNGTLLTAEIKVAGKTEIFRYDAADSEIFSLREPETMYLGFMAVRGCSIEADLDAFSVEYKSPDEAGGVPPVLYASANGSSLGSGTLQSPLDLQSAIDQCVCGQEIRALPGYYKFDRELVISPQNSGSNGFPKKITTEKSLGVWTVLDFGGSTHSFRIEGDHWDISYLAVVRGYGFQISGSHNQIRNCCAVANLETGFLIRHPLNESPEKDWPSHNEIVDCTSCLNMDLSEQHADGFACKVAAGSGNRFIRCSAWMNSDDGFDLFSKNRSIGAVRLEDCRSCMNGYVMREGRIQNTKGNGNGFKLGGSGLSVDHEAVNCEAIANRGYGFTSNSNPHMKLDGCSAGNNKENYVFYFTGAQARPINLRKDCMECDTPSFDIDAWAKQQKMQGAEDVIRSLGTISIKEYNDGLINDAVGSAAALYEGETDDRPGILVMCSSLYGGGAERVACRLACGLAERYRVVMLYIQDKGQTYPLDPSIKVIRIPVFRGTWEASMEGRIEFTRQIKELFKIRTSVSFMFTMNKINVRSGEKTKVICSERNNPAKRDPEHLDEINGLYELADHVVFQSETVRDLFSEKVKAHHSIILNPVSISCQRTRSRRRIVNVGRLVPQKNQAMLIRAFAKFHESHPDYTLAFYGTGELAEELQTLAKSLKLEKAVEFHGHVRDVHTAISDAEIFALSSDYEGLSNALLECMMMGLPCISTRCEGSSDVIQSGENGILVDIGSEEQMMSAMTQLADDKAFRERLGEQARKSSEQFETDHILNQWKRLIEEI